MLNEVLNLVKKEALGAVTKAGVPSDKKDAAVEAVTSSIASELKSNLSLDNISSLSGLLSGDSKSLGSNSMVSSIQNNVISSLIQKVGLNKEMAGSIATAAVPALLSLLSKKSSDSKDSFNFESLIHSFKGDDNGGGIMGALGKLFGK